ncbi:hypothetical protein B0H14DRAFT_2349500, partial [Mycena olivaceomarginata]
GCGSICFRNCHGLPAQNRFFTILVSISMKLIWDLRNERVFETHIVASEAEIHNRWVAIMNTALKQDKLLTNRAHFGSLGIKKQLVLDTWSSALLDEDSLPDDWTRSEGVLVSIRPITQNNGVG